MEDSTEDLKKEINNLIWMHSPEGLTLGRADQIANHILQCVQRGVTETGQQVD